MGEHHRHSATPLQATRLVAIVDLRSSRHGFSICLVCRKVVSVQLSRWGLSDVYTVLTRSWCAPLRGTQPGKETMGTVCLPICKREGNRVHFVDLGCAKLRT